MVNPDVVNLETNLRKSIKPKVDGYKCMNRNRQNKNMGRVASLVGEKDVVNVLKVTEGLGDKEYIITKYSQLH